MDNMDSKNDVIDTTDSVMAIKHQIEILEQINDQLFNEVKPEGMIPSRIIPEIRENALAIRSLASLFDRSF